jgi:hypothetical protein
MVSAAVAITVVAAFLREGRMPPRSIHPRHQQHKPMRGGGEGSAASRRRGRRRVKEEEPPRPPPLPSSSTYSSTPLSPHLPLLLPREHKVLDEMLARRPLLLDSV